MHYTLHLKAQADMHSIYQKQDFTLELIWSDIQGWGFDETGYCVGKNDF